MKALSLTNPWAWLVTREPTIALPRKDIENRTWNTKFRGEFLIHAAKGMTRSDYDDAVSFVRSRLGYEAARTIPPHTDLMRGGFVGRARLVDVIVPCNPPEYVGDSCSCNRTWHMGNQFGYVLTDVVALPFVAYSGLQRFFNVADDALPPEYRSVR